MLQASTANMWPRQAPSLSELVHFRMLQVDTPQLFLRSASVAKPCGLSHQVAQPNKHISRNIMQHPGLIACIAGTPVTGLSPRPRSVKRRETPPRQNRWTFSRRYVGER